MNSDGIKTQRRRYRPRNRKRALSTDTSETPRKSSAAATRAPVTVHTNAPHRMDEDTPVSSPLDAGVSTGARRTRKRNRKSKKPSDVKQVAREGGHTDSDVELGVTLQTSQDIPPTSSLPRISNEFLSSTPWSDAGIQKLLAKSISQAIKDAFKFSHMTIIQHATLPILLDGKDILAKAKTGGGKTLAFLIPIVQRLIERNLVGTRDYVGALILAPTRELAQQIFDDAEVLTSAQRKPFRNRIVMGGVSMSREQRTLSTSEGEVSADILVATPGRCVDHIQNTPGFAQALSRTLIFVLDEADHMLDMGFEKELNAISAALPAKDAPISFSSKKPRANGDTSPITLQTILFSATVPPKVLTVAKRYLADRYEFVDTVRGDTMETNKQVSQEVLILPLNKMYHGLFHILAAIAKADPHHKTIVFFPTARLTQYMAYLCRKFVESNGRPFKVIEIHSRNTQSKRNASSEEFRNSRGCVLFSSDVSARGLDYPDITDVIQVGYTERENYIHRVGRTARAGKRGRGLLLVSESEAKAVLSNIADVPVQPFSAQSYETAVEFRPTNRTVEIVAKKNKSHGSRKFAVMDTVFNGTLEQICGEVSKNSESRVSSQRSFSATLGFYNSLARNLGWNDATLVQNIAAMFSTVGLPEIPGIPRKTLGKMRLLGVPGLRAV